MKTPHSFAPTTPHTTTTAALTVQNVVKTFGNTRAVDGLSFEVQPAEVLALLGPNGAGKTTTIEMCEGFVTPTSGTISVLGYNPVTDPQAVRDRIGIMLQGGGGYPGVKVKEMLTLAASYSAHPHDVDWLLDVVGLTEYATSSYRRLSGGQQQRLSLALALVGRPQLVFLDEPTAGMDAQSRRAVWELITALKADGVTVVLTTHLMDEAEALSDRVIIVDRGTVVAQGTPADLMAGDTSTTAVTFAATEAIDKTQLQAALAASHRLAQAASTLTLPTRNEAQLLCDPQPATLAELTQILADLDIHLRQLSVGHRNLEAAFLDITGHEIR
ncbi:ABC transporter ATP-binding protein [Corynebacterium choanae]|uniref:Daunorubicin/doxorubicin resistance ATP-binding protein DrrA n=1 Tax=Corynebacterium choanae TaxID=1862358 RepID=A0A3G6J6P6_9CORY|nr:ABC transporter ATP-binding protein [Corynebacterium choanae]AZA13619.1 Daunorubicin/doxorubicin resistance ATP-binding protein DrrA [Corynebacterium choanae]